MRLIFWLLCATTVGVFLTMLFWSGPLIMADAQGMALFDARLGGYSTAEAKAFLAALSVDGRDFYLNVQHRLDSAFPALLAVVLVMGYAQVFQGWVRWVASTLPLVAAGFDYLENAAVAVMLRAGDGVTEAMVMVASQWTERKWIAIGLAVLALVEGLVRAWRANRKETK